MAVDTESIAETVRQLDEHVDATEAWVQIVADLDHPEESSGMRGNRQGYLRLGIEILKGAIEKPNEKTNLLPVDLCSLTTDDSDINLSWFELVEGPRVDSEPGGKMGFWGFLGLLGCAILVIAVGFVFVTGFNTIATWMRHK